MIENIDISDMCITQMETKNLNRKKMTWKVVHQHFFNLDAFNTPTNHSVPHIFRVHLDTTWYQDFVFLISCFNPLVHINVGSFFLAYVFSGDGCNKSGISIWNFRRSHRQGDCWRDRVLPRRPGHYMIEPNGWPDHIWYYYTIYVLHQHTYVVAPR